MKRFLALFFILFFISCSSGQKFLPSQIKSATTPGKLLSEVEKLAKQENASAMLVGVISSDNWPSGLAMWTNDEIDNSYVEANGTAPRWDFYYAKSPQSFVATDKPAVFGIPKAELFGFRYIAAESNNGKGGYVKLNSEQFSDQFIVPNNQAISFPQLDADQALQFVQKNMAERFTSLKVTDNPLKPERRKIVKAAYALEQNKIAGTPVWEIAAIFEDSFGNKKGALIYINGNDANASPWEIDPFDVKVEMRSKKVSKNKVNIHEIRTRDFTKSKELLAEWTSQAENAKGYEQLMQHAPTPAAAPNP